MNFKHIPKEYRPVPFWSWNEKLNAEETREQVRKMNDAGIGGFFMHARGGLQTEYMGKEWFENVEAAAEEAEACGMHPWAYDENGWPSGFGGGIVNGKGLRYQQKYLRYSETAPKETARSITKASGYYFYYEVNPYYVDTLDGAVIRDFLNEIYEPYYEKMKGKIDGFFTDEPQISRNGIPWSLILPEEYQKRWREDLLPLLPELFKPVGRYQTTRVRFWKTVTELFSENFMKQIYDWCEAHGFRFTGHLVLEETLTSQLCSNGACMPHYEYFHIPGMDWLGRHNTPSLTTHQLRSVACQMGKKQVLSETFALCGHNVGHDELKWIYEYQMVRGVNLLCQHLEGYSNRGLRKRDYPPAMYIQQPWWNDYHVFNDAMSRVGMLLSEGDDGVDTLVMHNQTTAWANFDDNDDLKTGKEKSASFAKIREYHDDLMRTIDILEKKHVNFHLGDEILMERHAFVDGASLVIGKKRYTKIVLPKHELFLENTERLLEKYRKNGGLTVSAEALAENPVINIPEITYCERHTDEYDLYYFVNSTKETYLAEIPVGNRVLDIATGELSDFGGTHEFKQFESLLLIDDRTGRRAVPAPKNLKPIELSGEWQMIRATENSITLDTCDYYFDGKLEEKNGYILNAMYRAIDRMKKTHITMVYTVHADYRPETVFLAAETPEIFEISVNGVKIDKKDCGYFRDKAFRKMDISDCFREGENTIILDVDFEQSEAVYENIRKSREFESEKNKLTFDMEIEQIYLVGDFAVEGVGKTEELKRNAFRFSGKRIIKAPVKKLTLEHIEQQGFLQFAGELTVSKTFTAEDTDLMLDFEKCGINAVRAEINGKKVGTFLWEPFRADVSRFVTKGENEITLTLVGNLRNMQGPFYLSEGESYQVSPASFYKEPCLWLGSNLKKNRWSDDPSFVHVSLRERSRSDDGNF